jgi:hypothetical protein
VGQNEKTSKQSGLEPVGQPEHVRGGFVLTRFATKSGGEVTYISRDKSCEVVIAKRETGGQNAPTKP